MCNQKPNRFSDDYMSTPKTLKMERNHFLNPDFEDVIQLVGSSGLLQYYVKLMQWHELQKNVVIEDDSEPKTFAVEDLIFGFVIWLCSCALSIIAFLIERVYFLLAFALKQKLEALRILMKKCYDRIIRSLSNFRVNLGKFRNLVRSKFRKSISTFKKVRFYFKLKRLTRKRRFFIKKKKFMRIKLFS
jgi:hypothetical protein